MALAFGLQTHSQMLGVSLMITNFCLKYLQALTTNLQAEAKDIVEAVQEISSIKAALNNVRTLMNTAIAGFVQLSECVQT